MTVTGPLPADRIVGPPAGNEGAVQARPVNHTRWKERLSESFWLIPCVCLVVATALALALIQIDDGIGGHRRGFGFAGGPESARQVLATIASSMLTLAGLVFSITIVALQLTSTQFSPRALRTFLRDRRTQLSLGIFVATFFYALVALREVRGQDNSGGGQFVPGVTITGAFVLAAVGVGTFVFYIHHISQSIRVITIIRRIGEETTGAIGCLPDEVADPPVPATPTAGPVKTIASSRSGVVAGVEVDDLVEAAAGAGAVVEVVPGMGDFVPRGGRSCGSAAKRTSTTTASGRPSSSRRSGPRARTSPTASASWSTSPRRHSHRASTTRARRCSAWTRSTTCCVSSSATPSPRGGTPTGTAGFGSSCPCPRGVTTCTSESTRSATGAPVPCRSTAGFTCSSTTC